MTTKEKLLAAKLLKLAAERFHEDSCTDMDADILDLVGFTAEEEKALLKDHCKLQNWDPKGEEFRNIQIDHFMDLMASKLEEDSTRGGKIGPY